MVKVLAYLTKVHTINGNGLPKDTRMLSIKPKKIYNSKNPLVTFILITKFTHIN